MSIRSNEFIYGSPFDYPKETDMGKISVRVFDKKTESEITEGIGFVKINDREHYGRQHITVMNHAGVPMNVGILNEDGTIEAQPGYDFKVERD